MKKIFLFATMVAATVLASCNKSTDIDTNVIDNPDGPQVLLTLGSEDAATRAFFDNTAMAETWESEIKNMSVYIFDASGKFIIKRSLTTPELSAKSARFVLPNSAAGTNCSFYVVANANYGNVADVTAMDAMTESETLDEYNGTFAQTGQARKRTVGFVMTGKMTATIAAAGSSTTVAVTLKRTVAKIALRIRMDASFSTYYGNGTVTINSVKLSKVSAASNSFYQAGSYASRGSLYETTQTPQKNGSYYDGCFYAYENGTLTAGNRVMLTLTGVFDGDGISTTTADRLNVEYEIELTGASGGEIKRNGYYRVDAAIKGLSGDGTGAITVNISAENWETPVTQTISLGN